MDLLTDSPLVAEVVVGVGLLLLLCLALPVGVVYVQVSRMRQGIQLDRLDEQTAARMYDELREDAEWALAKGFEQYEGMYTFKAGATAFLGVWRHTQHPTYFILFLTGGKKVLTFITEFTGDLDLTTGDTNDLQLCPQAPGHYMQTFRKPSREGLLNGHLAAARYITTMAGVCVEAVPWGFEKAFTKGEMVQAAYTQSLLAWPVRAPYWFFIRRLLVHNKSIEQLHKAGKLLLPNDRGYVPFTLEG